MFLGVGIVFVPTFFIFFNARSNLRHKNLATSQRTEATTRQHFHQEEHFADSQKDTDATEFMEPDENLFPVQKPYYESCLVKAREDKLQFHEPVAESVIYSGFLDYRFKEQAFIRLISILPAYGEIPQMYCHFMDLNTYEFFTSIVEVEELGTNHGQPYQGFISSCDLPEQIDGYTLCSVNVSLEPEPEPQTSKTTKVIPLHVVDRRVNTETYSLCVPPITDDISAARLVEFLELSHILGVSHFTFYNSKASQTTLDVLRYYKEKGLVSILPWELPQHIGSNIEDDGKTVALNDCLYRNLERFDYVAFNNLDEFIVPFQDNKTPKIFETIGDDDTAGYCFQSFKFVAGKSGDNISKTQLFTQKFTSRTKYSTDGRSRCIALPKKVFSVDLNSITNPTETYYPVRQLEPSLGSVFYYGECYNGERDCGDSYQDLTMAKYRDELEMRFNVTMSYLGHHG